MGWGGIYSRHLVTFFQLYWSDDTNPAYLSLAIKWDNKREKGSENRLKVGKSWEGRGKVNTNVMIRWSPLLTTDLLPSGTARIVEKYGDSFYKV